jgi:hypothetical protein
MVDAHIEGIGINNNIEDATDSFQFPVFASLTDLVESKKYSSNNVPFIMKSVDSDPARNNPTTVRFFQQGAHYQILDQERKAFGVPEELTMEKLNAICYERESLQQDASIENMCGVFIPGVVQLKSRGDISKIYFFKPPKSRNQLKQWIQQMLDSNPKVDSTHLTVEYDTNLPEYQTVKTSFRCAMQYGKVALLREIKKEQ